MNQSNVFNEPWRRFEPPLENMPNETDWCVLPTQTRSWWLLRIMERYVPNSSSPEERGTKSYHRDTALVYVPEFDHSKVVVMEALAESWNWLAKSDFLREDSINREFYLITTKGMEFADNPVGEFTDESELHNIHHLIAAR